MLLRSVLSALGLSLATSRLLISNVPSLAMCCALSSFSRVVLPLPEGPMRAIRSPCFMVRLIAVRALVELKDLEMSLSSIIRK